MIVSKLFSGSCQHISVKNPVFGFNNDGQNRRYFPAHSPHLLFSQRFTIEGIAEKEHVLFSGVVIGKRFWKKVSSKKFNELLEVEELATRVGRLAGEEDMLHFSEGFWPEEVAPICGQMMWCTVDLDYVDRRLAGSPYKDIVRSIFADEKGRPRKFMMLFDNDYDRAIESFRDVSMPVEIQAALARMLDERTPSQFAV